MFVLTHSCPVRISCLSDSWLNTRTLGSYTYVHSLHLLSNWTWTTLRQRVIKTRWAWFLGRQSGVLNHNWTNLVKAGRWKDGTAHICRSFVEWLVREYKHAHVVQHWYAGTVVMWWGKVTRCPQQDGLLSLHGYTSVQTLRWQLEQKCPLRNMKRQTELKKDKKHSEYIISSVVKRKMIRLMEANYRFVHKSLVDWPNRSIKD